MVLGVICESSFGLKSAINKTTVEVTFNKAFDQASSSNFTIAGGKVNSATLSENKKSVTLDVSGLNYNTSYNLVTVDVVADGQTLPSVTTAFKTPTIQSLWDLQVVPAKGGIEADGKDNTTVTFQLVNKVTGQVDTKANDIVLDLNTTYGSLAQKRATIQNGKATVVLRSEFNAKGVTAKVDAQIIEASGDYADLIGEIAGSANVQFLPSGSENVDATYLTAANTNEADRVTLTFDKKVTVADFIETNENGQLTGVLREDNTVAISQNGTPRAVKGFVSGPTEKTLIAVLDSRDDANAIKTANVLTDNSDVNVAVTMVNSSNQPTESNTSFKFTDARVPQVTSVNVEGMNKLIVKFSEPIASADFLIDGTFKSSGNYEVTYGSFKFDEIKKEFVDNRDIVTIELDDTFEENEDATPGFFTAGKHALQVSTIKDFAALSDNNNIGSTQNLGFTVNENKDIAQTTVKVDSPNQYRLTFDKDATIATPESNIELQVYDTETKEWVKAENGKAGLIATPAYTVTKIPGDGAVSQYRVDVTSVWTTVYNTAATKDNYYNDQFRLVVKEGSLKTAVNGKTNTTAISLDLNFAGSPMNSADVQSPVISKVETTLTPGTYKVTMSEPVTAALVEEVEFLGKDKDGKTRTFAGTEGSYTVDGIQKSFTVTATDFEGMKEIVQKGGSENWTLVLKDVTDDIGNKAATVTKDFLIKKDEANVTPFQVVKNVDNTYKVTGNASDAADTITITFTDSVALTGTEASIDTANFTLNGDKLPVGSSIALATDDDTIEKNTIKISVKPGTLLSSNVITLGRNLQSADGKILTGEYSFTFKAVTLTEQAAADQGAATPVTQAITALPAAGDVTVDDTDAIEAARIAYDGLTPAQKALVTNVGTLTAAEEALEVAQQSATDQGAATPVTQAITALPAAGDVTVDDTDAIEAARIAYDGLTPAQKALVTNVGTLTAAEEALGNL
ncbi:hypothetical protein [Sporosarcina sp. FSL K6-1508]|uniref:hypothetical protein n=1 Tax=Sporosarcina sp. FSL K6-1508 TaxID=2921553 RepID=UPI0030FCFE94